MQIIDRLVSLRRREHDATVDLIETLVECQRTKAHVDAGYANVFRLLVERLDYSRAAASRRFAAMRCVLRCPDVIEMLRAHRTSLTALAKIAPVLDDAEDPVALLRSIDGLGPDEIEATVAAMRPVPKPIERVRALAVVAKTQPFAHEMGTFWGCSAPEPGVERETVVERESPAERGTTRRDAAVVEPDAIAPDPGPTPAVALSFTLTREAHAALQSARAKLGRTQHRPLTLEETVNALVDHFHTHEKVARPKARVRSRRRTRHIAKATRAAVFERDGHRCTFVAPDGTRCTATHDLQIDHVVPYARGGTNDVRNLRTMCGAHNRRLGEVEFGSVGRAEVRTARA